MPRLCSVPNCPKSSNPKKTYFELPKDPERYETWCRILNLDNRCWFKRYVCEVHFKYSQFTSPQKVRLKSTAIPIEKEKSKEGNKRVPLRSLSVNTILPSSPTESSNLNPKADVYPTREISPVVNPVCHSEVQIQKETSPLLCIYPYVMPTATDSINISPLLVQNSCSTEGQQINCSAPLFASTPVTSRNTDSPDDVFSPPQGVFLPSPRTVLKRKLKTVSQQNRRLRRKLDLQNKSQDINAVIAEHFKESPSLLLFIQSQVDRFKSPKKHYSESEKTMAFTLLYSCGGRGYNTLRKVGILLPALSTVLGWIRHFDIKPGINEEVFACIRTAVESMNDHEKDTVLVFDEMHIKRLVSYNKQTDEIEGIEDHGKNRRTLKAATQVSVTMIRGLNSNWMFPISYGFSETNTLTNDLKTTLEDCLKKLNEVGLNVRLVVSDMGLNNQALHSRLGVTISKPYIRRFKKKIYVIYDVPHLIKLVRNHFKKRGYDIDGEKVRWSHVRRFFDLDSATECRMAPRLTTYHLNITDLSKQKVKLATQLLSKSVSDGIYTCTKLGSMRKKTAATAKFIKKMDILFDVLNISKREDFGKPWKSGKQIAKNIKKIGNFRKWINHWEIPGNNRQPDCIRGLKETLHGIQSLSKDLKKEDYGYILTRKMQQDCLENYFSFQRMRGGRNSNPTTVEFRHNFRYLFSINVLKNPTSKNCEDLEDMTLLFQNMIEFQNCLQKFKAGKNTAIAGENTTISSEDDDEFEDSVTEPESNDESRTDIIINDFFETEFLEDIPLKDQNVNAYMASWAVKAGIRASKCKTCLLLLHEPTEYSEADQLTICKSMGTSKVYRKSVVQEAKEVFLNVGERFKMALRVSLNDSGTAVLRNVYRFMKQEQLVADWIVNCNADCKIHREIMIKLFLRTKIFHMIKLKNQTYKDVKSSEQTREDLRHQ